MFLPRGVNDGFYTSLPSPAAATETFQGSIPASMAPDPSESSQRALGIVKDEQGRRTWNVIVRKLPYEARDVARAVMPDDEAAEKRSFQAIGQAALDDERYPVGSTAAYSLRLTDAEAQRFKAASNALDVSPAVAMSRPPLIWRV